MSLDTSQKLLFILQSVIALIAMLTVKNQGLNIYLFLYLANCLAIYGLKFRLRESILVIYTLAIIITFVPYFVATSGPLILTCSASGFLTLLILLRTKGL
jgi:hypothetical protein